MKKYKHTLYSIDSIQAGNLRSLFVALFVLASVLSSCATRQTAPLKILPSSQVLMPGVDDSTRIDVIFHLSENYLTRRSRVVITPQLVAGDSVYGEYPPVVLDASIYRKKVERLEVLDGYSDPYVQEARMIDNRKSYEIPYTCPVILPAGITNAHLRAVVSTDGCGECTGTDTLILAEVADSMNFFRSEMKQVCLDPDFVVPPKIREGKGKANLQFEINRFDIKMDMGHNATEMEKILNRLRPVLNDSLSMLNKLEIVGIASADGSLAFNTTLARNRALSAKKWLSEKLHLPYEVQQLITVKSRPEGWKPVLEAMRRAEDEDASAVASILALYSDENDDVQEYHIRRLPAWNRIKDNYLQKDRVVEYLYSEEELLRVSELVKTDHEREEVYRTMLRYFPESGAAANNLAVIYHRNRRTAEAVALLEKHTDLPEARYNLGVMKAESAEWEVAYTLLAPFADLNAAILALRTGRKAEAKRIINSLPKDTKGIEQLRDMIR